MNDWKNSKNSMDLKLLKKMGQHIGVLSEVYVIHHRVKIHIANNLDI